MLESDVRKMKSGTRLGVSGIKLGDEGNGKRKKGVLGTWFTNKWKLWKIYQKIENLIFKSVLRQNIMLFFFFVQLHIGCEVGQD